MKTELEKMLNGEMYNPHDKELMQLRDNARKNFRLYNLSPSLEALEKIFGKNLDNVHIEAPIYCDYGINTELGSNVYMNYNCTILDCAKVKIGNDTMFGPNVQIYTARHPLDYETRSKGLEDAKPITIGNNCWVGGGVIILAGVEIGDNCVIGAGSVVTKSIPANSLAFGNPAKVIRSL